MKSFLLAVLLYVSWFYTPLLSLEPDIVVRADRETSTSSLTPSQQELNKLAGAIHVKEMDSLNKQPSTTLAKSLLDIPGLYVRSRNQSSQTRLSIRGSGIARNADTRGIALQFNGLPLNAADSDFDYLTAIEPLSLSRINVLRSTQSQGAVTHNLGGSIDFISKTGLDPNTRVVRAEFGSYDFYKQHASAGWKAKEFDGFVSLDQTTQDGFRDQSQMNRQHLDLNLGWRKDLEFENRLYFTRVQSSEELPGALTKSQIKANPSQAASSTNPLFDRLRADWHDDITWNRLADRFIFQADQQRFTGGVWLSFAEIHNPRNQIFEANYQDTGARFQYEIQSSVGDLDNTFSITLTPTYAWSREQTDQNLLGGISGAKLDETDRTWFNTDVFIQNRLQITTQVSWISSLQLGYASRSIIDQFALAGESLTTDQVDYYTLAPSTGLLYEFQTDQFIYWNLSNSHEPPTLGDLYQQGASQFVSQKMQTSLTTELGTRGEIAALQWDLAFYQSWIKDELLISETFPGSGLSETRNSQDSVHRGIETAVSWDFLKQGETDLDDSLLLSLVYSWSDFTLIKDPLYQDRALPGVPEHLIQSSINYENSSGFSTGLSCQWQPHGIYADYANSLKSSGFYQLDWKVGYEIKSGLHLFFEIQNLVDQSIIHEVSVIGNAGSNDQRVFWPAAERAFYGGINWIW